MRWMWDVAKAEINRRKHKVSFETALLVFDDPLALSIPDPHPDGNRWRTVGAVGTMTTSVLFVVHTELATDINGEAVGRIISARKATASERRRYVRGF